ncbi:small multi-drug export protein [Priestia endophytica]|uniref:small multi-drug export protein n=1 Tax=Priestia endophytica TaxID=135735 RepID=UPI00203E1CCA|nr:small multi-drug export protein [Priestia endophytica]MCM3538341.1 small multi-drug export protein [Priestia endophytica]
MVEEILYRIKEMELMYQFMMIFVIGFIPFLEAHVAVPLGVLLKLPFILTTFLGIGGNIISVLLLVLIVTLIKDKLNQHDRYPSINRRFAKARHYFDKYGVPGLALLGPIVGTNHISTLVSVAAGVRKENIVLWQVISISIWGIGSGLFLFYGIAAYQW